MKRHTFLIFSGLALTVCAASALAEDVGGLAPDQARARQEQLKIDSPSWAKKLEKEGFLDRSATGAYRYGIPITRFADGIDLKASYGQVPGTDRKTGIVYFRIPLQ